MTDFRTVSGAFSVINFAGQLLQGIQFLIGFYGDIVSAPDYIKDLNADLKTLEALLKDIISLSGSTTASTATSPSVKLNATIQIRLLVVKDEGKWVLNSRYRSVIDPNSQGGSEVLGAVVRSLRPQ